MTATALSGKVMHSECAVWFWSVARSSSGNDARYGEGKAKQGEDWRWQRPAISCY
jgi:hypothetical protein